jgi:hypothetical protein
MSAYVRLWALAACPLPGVRFADHERHYVVDCGPAAFGGDHGIADLTGITGVRLVVKAQSVFLASIAVVVLPAAGSAQQPTTEELERWTAEVPPEVMKTWLAAMPSGSSPQSALKEVLSSPELVNRLRAEDDIRQHAVPSAKQIDAVETALSHEPCIGNLGRWARRYSFAVDYSRGRVDDTAIWFNLREAGRYGFETGVRVGKPRDFPEVDDRQFRIATGTYHLNDHRLKIDACGNNRGQPMATGRLPLVRFRGPLC